VFVIELHLQQNQFPNAIEVVLVTQETSPHKECKMRTWTFLVQQSQVLTIRVMYMIRFFQETL
jgi:hypothetical protein